MDLVPVCREGETMAIAAGLWVGGKKPVVLIQNTGIFESGDSIRGLGLDVNQPLVMLVGYRGWSRHGVTSDSAARFIEHILHAAGKTNRIGSIESGNTVGDYLEEEIEHGHTVSMKLMHVDWDGGRVHLSDHPGYLDFVGELASSAAILAAVSLAVSL